MVKVCSFYCYKSTSFDNTFRFDDNFDATNFSIDQLFFKMKNYIVHMWFYP